LESRRGAEQKTNFPISPFVPHDDAVLEPMLIDHRSVEIIDKLADGLSQLGI
jgi:hypothetical protein